MGPLPLVEDDELSWQRRRALYVDRYAELYSLSVAPRLRGRGIGTQLLDFVDQELARLGIHDLKVAVMTTNKDALRLYERRGLLPAEVVPYRFISRG